MRGRYKQSIASNTSESDVCPRRIDLDPEEQFLHDARNGNIEEIRKLLDSRRQGETNIDINCKGKSKSNLGWTPLHLACYFGHKHVVEELLKAGAEVNVLNDLGDTPLHRAAYTGRQELVMLLLQYNAFATIKNGTAQTPKEVTKDKEIRIMLEAAERTEERKLEEQLLAAVREGQTGTVAELLNLSKPPNINCVDLLGNTPLHCTAYRGQKQCALKLLRSGADPGIKNKNNQTALDLAKGAEMKEILEGNPLKVSADTHYCKEISGFGVNRTLQKFEGPVWKSSRFFGWRLYWVVLQDGVLSWYPKQSDAAANKHRQGCKHLTQAVCTKWLEAIEEHSAYSTHYCSQEQVSEEEEEDVLSVGQLSDSLQTARVQVCKSLRFYSTKTTTKKAVNPRKFFERVFSDNTSICIYFKVRSLRLEQEQEKSKILSEALQTLATEHHELEQSVVKRSPSQSVLSEDEFYDAVSGESSGATLLAL
ncbi:UNVERIFIED_CONTAM: hypothetical protein FKN15_040177 [Acipenser sinensis]